MAPPNDHQDLVFGEPITFKNPEMVLDAINLIDNVIQITSDANTVLDQMMAVVLKIFDTSRAWLFHPCNPELPSFNVTFECTTPEYPGANALQLQVPMTDDMADYCRRALSAVDGPEVDPSEGQPVTNDIAIRFNVKSMLFMALRPKSGEPWMFGLHQCDRDRIWTKDEKQLFYMIGQRIAGCIDNFLYVRLLKESEKRFKLALEAVCDAIWDWRVDSGEVYLNPGWYKILSFEPYELPQEYSTWTSLLHPDDREHAEATIKNHLETDEPFSMEFRMQAKDGHWKWILGRGRTVERNSNGCAIRMIGTNVDITERKASEAALQDSEQKTKSILNAIPDMMFILSSDGTTLDFMAHSENDLYRSQSKIIGSNIKDTMPSEFVATCMHHIEKTLNTGKLNIFEYRLSFEDGNKDYEARLVPFGENHVLAIVRNVTEMKLSKKSLIESEERFRLLVESSPIAIMMLRDGKYIYGNSASAKLLGYDTPEKIIGVEALKTISPDFHATLKERMERIKKGNYNEPIEIKIIKPNGEYAWTLSTSISIKKNGRQTAVIFGQDITVQKIAQDTLRQSEERYRSLIMQSADCLILHDLEGHILDVNICACKTYGYSRQELLKMKVSDLDPDYEDRVDEGVFYDQMTPGKSTVFEARQQSKDGRVFPVEVRITLINFKGKTLIQGLCRDISEQKEAERQISALASVVDSSDDIIVVKDIDLRVVATNDAFVRASGRESVSEVIGKTDAEIFGVSPETEPIRSYMADERQAQNLLKGEYIHREEPVVYPDAKSRTFLTKKYPIYEGDTLIGTGNISRDITEYKQIEKALKESEEKYRSMMESMDEGTYICSSDFHIEYMNPAMIKKIGRDATGEICHQALHGLDEQCPWCEQEKVMRGETIKTELVKSKVDEVYFISHSPIFHTNGTVSKLSVYRDITEMKKLETRIQHAQRMESIGNLAGGIAHDFNNILAPIIGISEMLIEDFPPESPESKNAWQIFKAGERGSDLVKQILAFSRQSEHKMIPTRLQHILKEALNLCRSTIPAYIDITQDIQNECDMILGDPSQIHQVVMNIITNAFHAIEGSGGTISVRLSQRMLQGEKAEEVDLNSGTYAVIHISDTGHGMPEEIIGKIFDPYFTTKEQGKGTGLGLAVVYGIVKEHKGSIKVKSEIGKGTTFEVYLPLMEEINSSESNKESEEIKGGNERILLVDDEEAIVELELRMLERLGYQVTSRTSSIEALELFRAKPDSFDLVISDMAMPNIPGDQLATELRAIRSDIPVIICTGFSERIREENMQKMGITGLLMKPILKSDLAKIVRKVLDEVRG